MHRDSQFLRGAARYNNPVIQLHAVLHTARWSVLYRKECPQLWTSGEWFSSELILNHTPAYRNWGRQKSFWQLFAKYWSADLCPRYSSFQNKCHCLQDTAWLTRVRFKASDVDPIKNTRVTEKVFWIMIPVASKYFSKLLNSPLTFQGKACIHKSDNLWYFYLFVCLFWSLEGKRKERESDRC